MYKSVTRAIPNRVIAKCQTLPDIFKKTRSVFIGGNVDGTIGGVIASCCIGTRYDKKNAGKYHSGWIYGKWTRSCRNALLHL